jgi:ribonucleoside-diphosphate reductase alpha chain
MNPVFQILKRTGEREPFRQEKFENAIRKAFHAVGRSDEGAVQRSAAAVAGRVEALAAQGLPTVEQIQDIVEETLATGGFADVAKAYILYRQERTRLRTAKRLLGVKDDLKLPLNAVRVLQRRYLQRDETGSVIETPSELFRRVARAVAAPDASYAATGKSVSETEETFYVLMTRGEFLPNSPTLMNAGTQIGQLSACFVLPIEDSLVSIFETLKLTALIQQSGGGTGFNFSHLRPRGDIVHSTHGIASGPVSFMRIYDVAADVMKEGGRRRGAHMGILRVDHPDVLEFIQAKSRQGALQNFSLSVGVTDSFMQAVEGDAEYELINPRTGQPIATQRARSVWELITASAWASGEPGLVFLDEIHRHNPTPHVGTIEATNPCGEVPLLPYEACNLGSINLGRMVANGRLDEEKLRRTVQAAIHFLDNVIDAGRFPSPEIAEAVHSTRKVGLGVMGLADALIELGIPYDSEEGISLGERVMRIVEEGAIRRSVELGQARGSFPHFPGSRWQQRGYPAMRNATVTSVAPTGTISILAGASSGIEPLFAAAYARRALEGLKLLELHPAFKRLGRERGFLNEGLLGEVGRRGSVRGLSAVPEDVQRLFATALDIAPEWHVRMQAAFQKHTDNAVSKTVNLPEAAAVSDVDRIYRLAHEFRCKGITVYRYGSRSEQVLTVGGTRRRPEAEPFVAAELDYSGGCPAAGCPF